ncbi:MAG: class I SAM-dependent methyltransferase [bacterium]|nr:class I SAM-dependent methyltransferase [bacterium]
MELKQIPSVEWQKKYDKLMKDPYLSKKYDRKRRIKEKRKYISELCPEIKRLRGKLILDIGPGPGEFLEVCREFGHNVWGIDAKLNDAEMGDEYIQLSKLMSERQKILVDYVGFEDYLINDIAEDTDENEVYLINFQGSLEQAFAKYMKGPRHRETKDASQLAWVIDDDLKHIFNLMFEEFHRILEPGGYVLIYGNGAKNVGAYDKLISATAAKYGFKLYLKKSHRLHKWRKEV